MAPFTPPFTLLERIEGFDWTYEFSDDIQAWRMGRRNEDDLTRLLLQHKAPFTFLEAGKFARRAIIGIFKEVGVGQYECPETGIKVHARDLLTAEKAKEIKDWIMAHQDIELENP